MIYSIQGKVTDILFDSIVIQTAGIGYEVRIPKNTFQEVQEGKTVALYTHHHIKEDNQELYGFSEKVERSLFRLLIKVNGLGCRTVLKIFDKLDYNEITTAIANEDYIPFKSCKGIGDKTAKAIIEHLKGKF